jgi:hypothetical protein
MYAAHLSSEPQPFALLPPSEPQPFALLPPSLSATALSKGEGEGWNLLHVLLATAAAQRPDALLSSLEASASCTTINFEAYS